MNFTSLRYFTVLAEELNFTRASKKLFISQQALSAHIGKLEQHFEARLFLRTTPLELTPAGQCLYAFAKETLLYEEKMTEQIHNLSRLSSRELTIGTTLSRGNLLMPIILPPFQSRFPDIKVNLIQSSSEFVEQLLLDKKVDVIIGFTPAPRPDIVSTFLCMDNLSLIFTGSCIRQAYPDDWVERIRQLSSCSDLSLIGRCKFIKMLDSLPLGKTFHTICRSAKINPEIYLEVRAIETMVALCLEGLGAIICPEMFITIPVQSIAAESRQKIYKFPLNTGQNVPSVSISYLEARPVAPYILEFVKIAQKKIVEIV